MYLTTRLLYSNIMCCILMVNCILHNTFRTKLSSRQTNKKSRLIKFIIEEPVILLFMLPCHPYDKWLNSRCYTMNDNFESTFDIF